jgi:hypothetical protein
MQLLQGQNPGLAAEGVWAHATPAPERGGLLIAAPDATQLLESERYWQVRAPPPAARCRGPAFLAAAQSLPGSAVAPPPPRPRNAKAAAPPPRRAPTRNRSSWCWSCPTTRAAPWG